MNERDEEDERFEQRTCAMRHRGHFVIVGEISARSIKIQSCSPILLLSR